MSLFRDMDLYKWIVVGSVLAVPGAIGYGVYTQKKIKETTDAIAQATKRDGYLEQIGKWQKQIEIAKAQRGGGNAIQNPPSYFEQQIFAASNRVSTEDFSPQAQPPRKGQQNRQRFVDLEYRIDFGKSGTAKKDFPMPRDLLFAILYNIESGATQGSSVWKLRRLKILNAQGDRLESAKKAPPEELEDNWLVKEMVFARREPDKDAK